MTPPLTPEALVERLARDLAREGGWSDPDAPWTENQVIIARGGAGEPVWCDFVDDARSLLGRETFTTLLAAHQQVTAESDEARAEVERLRSVLDFEKRAHRVATSELARLRAEGEAKDRRIAELSETWTDEAGTVWSPPTAWAYAKACAALRKHRADGEALRAALKEIADACPVTCDMSLAHDMAATAEHALARAATAREG